MKGKEYKNNKLSTKTKEVFFFKFEDEKIDDIKSREKNNGKETHFPFYNGKQKYKFIESIEFDGISPDIKGVKKAVTGGLGFTRDLSPIITELEKYPAIKKITISKTQETSFKRFQVIFNINDLKNIYKIIRPFNVKQGEEKRKITNNLLSKIFSSKFKKIDTKYIKGDLMEFIVNKDLENNEMSVDDVANIVKILPEEIKEQQVVYKIEEKIELIKIKNTKKEFEKLSRQSTDSKTLERRWHDFFKKNDWIFSHVLLLPVSIYDDEVYVGGKNANNRDGKVADFLYKNSLSDNACIIEIKTHQSRICNKTAYRGTNIFELNGKFTGAINQSLMQKHKIQKDYAVLLSEEKEKGIADKFYNVFNPKIVLVVGSLSALSPKQKTNFEIFRNSMPTIEIITFDEIGAKIDFFVNLIKVE